MSKNKYDVIIIGAGIGGLICGSYLALKGVRVLIIEQQKNVGGCCSSFVRSGYTFDVGVHYLGSCREDGGVINRVLKDLSLLNRINFCRQDPYDLIITPNERIFFGSNAQHNINELISYFPSEAENIKRFFTFLSRDLTSIYLKTRNLTLDKFLDFFTKNIRLRAVLAIPVGNIGLPPSKVSAFFSIMLYKEYVFDGGYYPVGGIQSYPDLLASKFQELGGDLVLGKRVNKILMVDGRVNGVMLSDKEYVGGDKIVANCDANMLFDEILDVGIKEKTKIKKIQVSASAFVMYLGLNMDLSKTFPKHLCCWYFPTYEIEKCYDIEHRYNLEKGLIDLKALDYLICHFPCLVDKNLAPDGKSVVRLETWVTQDNLDSWDSFKYIYSDKVLSKLSLLIPSFSTNLIEIKEVATPKTINKWVSTSQGAIFGWASNAKNENKDQFPIKTCIPGLYMTGSWALNGFGQCGIPIVTLSGKKTAELVFKDL